MKEAAGPTGAIALVGSGEYLPQMEAVDRALLRTLDATPARVAVLPTASALEPGMPERWNRMGVEYFRRLGAVVNPLLVLSRDDAHDPAIVAQLAEIDLFYFSGGNPQHVVETWRGTPAWAALEARRQSGAVLAGCSAGAMMMGSVTLDIRRALGGGQAAWVPGLGVLPGIATLPHFDRLLTRMTTAQLDALRNSAPPAVIVVGVDEDTALVRFRDYWQVLGRQGVSVFGPDGDETRYTAGNRVPLPLEEVRK